MIDKELLKELKLEFSRRDLIVQMVAIESILDTGKIIESLDGKKGVDVDYIKDILCDYERFLDTIHE